MNTRVPPRPGKPERGISCPRCGCRHLEVLYTRSAGGASGAIRRRRACRHCGRRITTVERPVQ